MTRATLSKDGRQRITFRIERRIDATDLVNLIALHASREGLEEMPEQPSRAWIERTAREVLRHAGPESYDYWSDDCVDADDIRGWAEPAVQLRFPELHGR